MQSYTIFYVGLIALIISSVTDIKKREVPDYVSVGLIFFGLIYASSISLILQSFEPLLNSLIGLGMGFLIAALMFYTGQWGGGDAKMLMGLGALFGMTFKLDDLFINLNLYIFLAGAIYGLLWSLYLSIRNFSKFKKRYKEIRKKHMKESYLILILSGILIILSIIIPSLKIYLLTLSILSITTFYLWVSIKSVEDVTMIKKLKPSQLTEGDWISEDIKIGGKVFLKEGKKITKKDIEKIKEYEEKHNPLIPTRRKYFFIPIWKEIKLSNLKKNDEITLNLIDYGIYHKKLNEKDYENARIYSRMNHFTEIKVKRKDKTLKAFPISLKEGDILMDSIKSSEYFVCGPKDLGIEKYQIEQLKKLYSKKEIKEVIVKEGIPFIPSFFIAYLMTFFMPNILLWISSLV
ncbi:hypothetical protein C0585_02235 [Candidatus Woesearchaeota archaeon]|nr:MAG: hypothetical protein C0585_02235 [Candidatus Woesearchaeota archaeon]